MIAMRGGSTGGLEELVDGTIEAKALRFHVVCIRSPCSWNAQKERQTARTDTSPSEQDHQRMMDLLNINRCGEVRTAIRSRLTPRITMSLKPIATRNSPTRCC